MKFSIAINMIRSQPSQDMREVCKHALELAQIADRGGFETAWVSEHHAIEMTISPNPFVLLSHWAANTDSIRLGTAVVVAPYWHPVRLAGEAALTDVLCDGRLELGIGRGAYQYEFDRMAGGMPQKQGGAYVKEIIPAVRALWQGDYAHDGELWSFPAVTSVPKPVQKPHPRIWVAARDPDTFDWAVKNHCNIMTTPLRKPFSEVESLVERFEAAVAEHPGVARPEHMMLRLACVVEKAQDAEAPARAVVDFWRHFENLFTGRGAVNNGFPEPVDWEVISGKENCAPEDLCENMLFGTPAQIVAKLKRYQQAGVDHLLYGANFGLPHALTKRSLELFISEVMPHFRDSRKADDASHMQAM